MPRAVFAPSLPPEKPLQGVKAATFQLLLDSATQLIQDIGHFPSIAEVASHARVSRATAYRYFPTRSSLITAVVNESLGPVRSFSSDNPDGRERVMELFNRTFPRFKEYEPQLRAAAQLSLEQWALERAGLLEEERYRRGHRVKLLEHALAPLAKQIPTKTYHTLHRAMSIVYGIEPYIVLRDIWDSSDQEIERTARWMVEALVAYATQADAPSPVKSRKIKR
jgi:AcrR family transcriptional regulator